MSGLTDLPSTDMERKQKNPDVFIRTAFFSYAKDTSMVFRGRGPKNGGSRRCEESGATAQDAGMKRDQSLMRDLPNCPRGRVRFSPAQ